MGGYQHNTEEKKRAHPHHNGVDYATQSGKITCICSHANIQRWNNTKQRSQYTSTNGYMKMATAR